MRHNLGQAIRRIGEAAGAVNYQIIRERKHAVVEYVDADGVRATVVMSVSASDVRSERNQVATLRRAFREAHERRATEARRLEEQRQGRPDNKGPERKHAANPG